MILSVTLNPSVDHALFVDDLKIGDTNRVRRTERDAGGKGVNLSRVVAELGAKTMATGFLGGGPGQYVRSVLDRQGVSHCFVDVDGDTRINFSVEDGSDRPPTTFNELGPSVTAAQLNELLDRIAGLADRLRWIAVGGSLPPDVPLDIFGKVIELAHRHGVKVALDADGEPLKHGLAAGPDFIKPNAKEASRVLGRPVESPEDAVSAASLLYEEIEAKSADPKIVVVSLGVEGAAMQCATGRFRGISPRVKARSTIGSGDSLIAGMLWATEQGHDPREALRWGLACGAATAATDGSEIARRPIILELLPQARVEPA